MRDLNFFEPYIVEPEKTSSKRLILIALTTILIFVLIFYPILNFFEIKSIKNEITFINESLNSLENQKKLDTIQNKKQSLEAFKSEFDILLQLDHQIKNRDVINDELMLQISKQIPNDIFFESMSINGEQVHIQGNAYLKLDIAQMEHNLRYNGDFYEIFIPSITENDGFYSFSITFKVREVHDHDTE
ncbi:Fimbrial assembly family protein [Alkaliphilus metalliredigens QYMF]|uniref:Fimbrial assembly family protein n=1 Tax=Alkaliphilus metalliredigens (strain QYMF) TaxID=293826 RepID=A6TTT3_ALKMQ|nr:PilN domain-containing protein [Alkaliphilus metalliredigens]ABR49601.1 Fimbrial assembly family protein [Alkaliphilus metalliredigens QYMF]